MDVEKAQLRRLFRQRRLAEVNNLQPVERVAAEQALARQLQPLLRVGATTASYAAQGAEIDPALVEPDLMNMCFPRVYDNILMFHLSSWGDLRPGYRGIAEPPSTAPAARPDIVLVPLVAATLAGDRLGQGGGFYDRTLARLRREGPLLAIGLAWDCQIAATLPHEERDVQLDHIATPTRLVDCRHHR